MKAVTSNFEWFNAAPIVKEALLSPEGHLIISRDIDVTQHIKAVDAVGCVLGTFEGDYYADGGYCGSFITDEGNVLLIDGGTALRYIDDYCNECRADKVLIVTEHDSDSIFAVCPDCDAKFDLINDGRFNK